MAVYDALVVAPHLDNLVYAIAADTIHVMLHAGKELLGENNLVGLPVSIGRCHDLGVCGANLVQSAADEYVVSSGAQDRLQHDWPLTIPCLSYTHLRAHETRHDLVCR